LILVVKYNSYASPCFICQGQKRYLERPWKTLKLQLAFILNM
jgi:hypothetical protein